MKPSSAHLDENEVVSGLSRLEERSLNGEQKDVTIQKWSRRTRFFVLVGLSLIIWGAIIYGGIWVFS